MARNDICCGALDLSLGIWLVGIHSLLHGLYGVGVVFTSYHHGKNNAINISFAVGSFLLIALSICIIIFACLESARAFKILGYFTVIVAAYVFSTGVVYLHKYDKLLAASILDKVFFLEKGKKLVEKDFAFTWWHVLTGYYVVLAPIWFYYAYVMLVFPKTVKPRSVCRRSAMRRQLRHASASFITFPTIQKRYEMNKSEDRGV